MLNIFTTATVTIEFPKLPTEKRDEIVRQIREMRRDSVYGIETIFEYVDKDYIEFEVDLDLIDYDYDDEDITEIRMEGEDVETYIDEVIMKVGGTEAYFNSNVTIEYDEDYVKERIKEVEKDRWIDKAYDEYVDEKLNGR